jgi:phage baseplate assembly protein V
VPTKGTWVWCFFDNNDVNSPVVLAAIPGITKTKQSGHGFTDPSGTYPLGSYSGKSDHNIAQVAAYLSNNVIQTPGGQLIEMNDGGHIKITHANGSFIQIENSGNYNVNITNNAAVTIAGTATINVAGDVTLTAPNVKINGQVNINGNLTVSGTTNSGGLGLNTHTHTDPQGGTVGAPING